MAFERPRPRHDDSCPVTGKDYRYERPLVAVRLLDHRLYEVALSPLLVLLTNRNRSVSCSVQREGHTGNQ